VLLVNCPLLNWLWVLCAGTLETSRDCGRACRFVWREMSRSTENGSPVVMHYHRRCDGALRLFRVHRHGATDAQKLPGARPTYNNGYDGQRFSAAAQITPANVGTLKRVCEAHLGDVGTYHSGPLVIDDTLSKTLAMWLRLLRR
jgi:hypothetical protein